MTSREVRRVVTGLDEDGRSTVATDGPPAVAFDAHARNRGDVPCTLIALMYGLDAGAQATEAGER